MIRNLEEGGMSNRDIAKELSMFRNTVSRMLKNTRLQDRKKGKRGSKLYPYRESIRALIADHNLSPIRILEEIRKMYAFSMILGYSRMRYAEFTTDISTEGVIKMHLNAFSFFGGFKDTILYDNMKRIVIDRNINVQESRFNSKFMDFAEYYGIII